MSRSSTLRSIGLAALLPLGFLFGGASSAFAGVAPASLRTLPQEGFEAIMGGELVIDGTRYGKQELLRAVVTGRAGSLAGEALKLRLLVAQEVARRIKEGAQPETFLISDDEVEGAVDEQAQYLQEAYPNGEYTVDNMMDGGLKAFKTQLQLTRLFNRTFLPTGDPAEYPQVTLTALRASEMGTAVLDQLQSEWEVNKMRATPAPQNPLYQSILFKEIYDYLQSTSVILEGRSVPSNVFMSINGDEISVLDVWNEIHQDASADDVLLAKKWLVNMHLLRKGLADVWLSDEEAKAEFEKHAAPFQDSIVPIESFATSIKRFPNMNAYREYRHAHDSFKKRVQAEMTPEALRQFADLRTRKMVGGATVDVDVILLSAYDFLNRKWKVNGWEEAEERAREVVKLLQENKDWDDVLDQFSEFYDPPAPVSGQQAPNTLRYKGRFRNQGRNELMQKLGEDEYQSFVNGGTLVDFIFFKLEEGSVGGVKKGPYGWYIPLMRKRTEKPIQNNQAQLITMAEQDYVSVMLGLYITELYQAAKIEGLNR